MILRITEENFIEEIKKRNEKALEYVIENYGWILKTVLKKHLFYLQDYYDECMNDCFLGIWENIESYNPNKSSFKNWIGGIAKYKSIDYTRKYLKDLDNRNIEDINIPDTDTPLNEILEKEMNKEIKEMLNCLSNEDKEIFKQLYFEEKNMDEISINTGLSKSILYNRLSKGREKIRKQNNIKGGYKK